ncbi:YidC/Oxa1 family membrane protein insertase [Streptomyces sp. NPDC000151]|uniref:YidC/Oxa1 family membrane protein insertase n=1 Tax=Streptomyces sp. NPDC000151 TaxID=3154244 RepID=UPI003316B4F3
MSVFATLGAALGHLADVLSPVFGASATAAAIVVCTLAVRAALHPLARAAVRGEKSRTALAPQMAEIRRKYAKDPERMQREVTDLYRKAGASPLAGCLPMLLQLPVFFLMYHLFTSSSSGLLGERLLDAPLGGRWADALADGGPFGPHGMVYCALFVLVAAVATWNYRRARKATAQATAKAAAAGTAGAGAEIPGMGAVTKLAPLLSFATLLTVAVVPLAASLYVVTSTTWTACERTLLLRDRDRALGRAADEAKPAVAPAAAAAKSRTATAE